MRLKVEFRRLSKIQAEEVYENVQVTNRRELNGHVVEVHCLYLSSPYSGASAQTPFGILLVAIPFLSWTVKRIIRRYTQNVPEEYF